MAGQLLFGADENRPVAARGFRERMQALRVAWRHLFEWMHDMAVRSTLLSLALGTLLATGMLPAAAANSAPTANTTTEAPR
ncbi:MAG: hypothetical protein ACRCWE_06330, partial [Stenotrophomonas maltophilia]